MDDSRGAKSDGSVPSTDGGYVVLDASSQNGLEPMSGTGVDASFSYLNIGEGSAFHASWSTGTGDEFLGSVSSVLSGPGSFSVDRPGSISRVSSTQSRVSSIGEENGVSSSIHDAARITNWELVQSLCKTNPDAARYAGRDGWTALHHACNRRCPYAEVVEALIRAYPDAILEEEEKGWTPLHYACRFKATHEVVKLLIHMYPELGRVAVSKADRQGRTPLYYAVRYDAPAGVVGMLLGVDPSVVLEEDQHADSPLTLVWDTWAEKSDGKKALQSLLTEPEKPNLSPQDKAKEFIKRLKAKTSLKNRWNKVNIFLKAALGFPVADGDDRADEESTAETVDAWQMVPSDGRKWRILHATAAIKCHPSLFLVASSLYPEQAFDVDDNDLQLPPRVLAVTGSVTKLTALHLAAASRSTGEQARAIIGQLLALNPRAAEQAASDGSLPFHMIVANPSKTQWINDGIRALFVANNRAVHIADQKGRLPLHRAASVICNKKVTSDSSDFQAQSIMSNLLETNSNAASCVDSSSCYPLHYVAQKRDIWDDEIEMLYNAHQAAIRARAGVVLRNQLPIHMAASNPVAKRSLISRLIQLHPRGATQGERGGKFPLHLACETGLDWNEGVDLIHNAYPDAVSQTEQNSRGWTALQMAAASPAAKYDLISNLVRLHPTSASVLDRRSRYAMHLGCLSGKRWEAGLQSLFDANPEALGSADDVGLIPFYIACFKYCAKPKTDGIARPKPVTRRLSRAVSAETESGQAIQNPEEASQLTALYQLLRADPTVLNF